MNKGFLFILKPNTQVEVGPSSFIKIKMLGKGDVGRVYLVREKKTHKLYAMKGNCAKLSFLTSALAFRSSYSFLSQPTFLWRNRN